MATRSREMLRCLVGECSAIGGWLCVHMLKGKSLINSPITADDTARVLGTVGGIIVDSRLCRVAAFALRHTSDRSTVILPWMGIKRIDSEGIFAWTATMLVDANELFDIRRLLKQGTIKQGTRLGSADEVYLGMLVDFFFDRQSGMIIRYEVMDGPFADSRTRYGTLPAMANVRMHKDTDTAYLPLAYSELGRLVENSP